MTEAEANVWSETLHMYMESVYKELEARWMAWKLDLTKAEMYEVIGALMARQVTLAVELAGSPSIWNGHAAPLILRAMTDVFINFAWILEDPLDRSRKFILHGLGQEKLLLEHHRNRLVERGEDPEKAPQIKAMQSWIDAQRYTFLLEVNVGSWSGVDTRTMAEQAGCLDLYRFAYNPFSAATHSMWQHVAKYNLKQCENPLHRFHQVPFVPGLPIDPDYLYRAAKYVAKTFARFDEKMQISVEVPSALEYLINQMKSLPMEESETTEAVLSEPLRDSQTAERKED